MDPQRVSRLFRGLLRSSISIKLFCLVFLIFNFYCYCVCFSSSVSEAQTCNCTFLMDLNPILDIFHADKLYLIVFVLYLVSAMLMGHHQGPII